MKKKLHVLDLCAGTKSIGRAFKKIYGKEFDVVYLSVDNMERHDPDFLVDVRKWNHEKDLRDHFKGTVPHFDIVWASPPCTEYSLAKSVGPPRNFRLADSIVKACWKIIRDLKPTKWYMENPSTGFLGKRPFMKKYADYKHDSSYCKYGRDFKKPTNIWTNVVVELKTCDTKTPCKHKKLTNTHPVAAHHSANYKAANGLDSGIHKFKAYEIPHGLLKQLFDAPPGKLPIPPAP